MTAMKTKNTVLKSVISDIKGAMKNKEIELKHELNDKEIQTVVKKCVKTMNEMIDGYRTAGREDTANDYAEMIPLYEVYLPVKITVEQLDTAIRKAISETPQDDGMNINRWKGMVRKAITATITDMGLDFDGKTVSDVLESILSEDTGDSEVEG